MSDHQPDEETPLLGDTSSAQPPPRKGNPLPKLQIAIVLLLQVCEPLTSQSIYPYINKVSTLHAQEIIVFTWCVLQLVSELDITGGDERKVGYYAGLIVSQPVVVVCWS